MAKATQFLDDGKAALEAQRLDTATDRAYYSMYHSARAILLQQGIPLPKTHSGLRSVIAKDLVRTRIVARRFLRMLVRGAQMREEATYTVYANHGQDVVQELLKDAAKLLALAEKMAGVRPPAHRR